MKLNQSVFHPENSRILVFVDARVKDYQRLTNGLQAGAEVFILHPEANGVEQITQILSQRSEIEGIHIVSHGAPGTLYLGDTELSLNTLERYAWQLQTWFDSVPNSSTPALVLYGCNVAATDAGTEFLEKLRQLTQAIVYASSTPVGNSSLGGDWDLDVCCGNAKGSLALVFQPEVLETYAGVLALTTGNDGKYTYYDSKDPSGKGTVSFNDIRTTGTALTVRPDQYSSAITLPFTFNFYSTPFTSINVTENGGITFGNITTAHRSINSNLPNSTAANSIFPFWDDLTGGQVYSKNDGNRFIVQWSNFAHQDLPGSSITFQVVLHKDSNNIDFVYQDVIFDPSQPGYDNGAQASIGLNKGSASALKYSYNQDSLNGITSIRFLTEPRLLTNTLTLKEGETVTLTSNNFSATDVDNSDPSRLTYKISELQNGQFLLNGTSVPEFTQQDINDGKVQFVHNGGEVKPSFNIQVTDGFNTTGANSASVTFTNVNDNSTLIDLVTSATFNENTLNAAAAIIDSSVTLNDVDSPDFNGGNLTVSYSSGGGLEDQLSISSSSSITLNSGNVSFNGVVIGTVDSLNNGSKGRSLVVNFTSSNANLGAVKALIENLTYQNTSDTPGANRSISVTVNDGDGGTSTPMTTIINVTPENDKPINNIPGVQSTHEDQPLTFTDSNLISISDPDAGTNLVQVKLSSTNGILNISGTNGLSFITGDGTDDPLLEFKGSINDINQALNGMTFKPTANYNGAASVQITTQDLGNSGSGTNLITSDIVNITVNAVNDAPVNTVSILPQSVNEDTDLVFSSANNNAISISDLDAKEGTGELEVNVGVTKGVLTLKQTTGLTFSQGNGTANAAMTFKGQLADINNALEGLIYKGNLNANGEDALTITTNDLGNTGINGFLSKQDTVKINVAAINDAPVNTVPTVQSVNEDTNLVFSSANNNAISINDVDVTEGTGEANVTLSVNKGVLTLQQTAGLTFAPNNGNGNATMIFQGKVVDINKALEGLTYRGNQDYNGADTLSITTNDLSNTGSGGSLSDSDTVNITVNAVNDVPINTVSSNQRVNEDTALVFSKANNNAISIGDVDVHEATGEVEVSLSVSKGVLNLQQTAGLTFAPSNSNGNATMTFQGKVADINNALEGLSYQSSQDYNGADILSITTNDLGNQGINGTLINTDTVNITIDNVNDAPVLANGIANQSATEDSLFSFTVAANTFSDIDPGNSFTYTATSSDGSALPSWLSFDSTTRTFSGTPTNSDVGSLDLKVTATDTAGASVSNTFNVVVVNTNDAPIVAIPDQTAIAYTPFNFQFAADTFNDLEGDSLTFSATLADGRPLPSWLSFDAATRTFSGFSTTAEVSTLNIRVTADDGHGGIGNDTFALNVNLPSNTVANTLNGTRRNNTLRGSALNDSINGYGGKDRLYGNQGNDNLNGDDGDDRLWGGSGFDVLSGGTGKDRLYGDNDNDTLIGGYGNDSLYGGNGDDILDGGIDKDTLYGDAGNDILIGGLGKDTLRGGSGNDKFVLAAGHGADTIRDFADTQDQFLLRKGLTFGQLSITQKGRNTLISTSSGELLATLTGVQASVITAADFSVL